MVNITIFGIVWLVICFFICISKSYKYLLLITLFSMVLQSTNVLYIFDTGVGPQTITCLIFILWSYFLFKGKNKLKSKNIINALLIAFLISIFASLLFNGVSEFSSYLKFIQVLIYVITAIRMYKLKHFINNYTLNRCLVVLTWFVLIFGIVQIGVTTGFLPRLSLLEILFYNDKSENVYYHYDNYFRVCSTFMEPSYCSCFLVGMFSYIICNQRISKKNVVMLLLILIEVALSFSTTGYISLFLSIILIYIFKCNKKNMRIIMPILLICSIIVFVFFRETLDTVIFSKLNSGSYDSRKYWNLNALEDFKNSIIWGVGFKQTRASTIVLSLLGQIGIFGFTFYVLIFVTLLFHTIMYRRTIKCGASMAIISVMLCQIIACPDIDLSVFWLFIYIYSMVKTYNWRNENDLCRNEWTFGESNVQIRCCQVSSK